MNNGLASSLWQCHITTPSNSWSGGVSRPSSRTVSEVTVKDIGFAIGLSLLFAISVVALAFIGVGIVRTK